MPTVPIVARAIAELENDQARYLATANAMIRNPNIANLLDRCALSLPFHAPGTAPVGLTLMGETLADRPIPRPHSPCRRPCMKFEHLDRFLEAHRVLAEQGHDELHFGHLSAIDRKNGVMWIKRGDIGFAGVRKADLTAVDLNGEKVQGDGPLHTELWLHLSVYAARPDVQAIAHSHAPRVVAYSAVEPHWPIIDQYSAEMSIGLTYYDRSGLIVTRDLGENLARSVGAGRICVLRSHGSTRRRCVDRSGRRRHGRVRPFGRYPAHGTQLGDGPSDGPGRRRPDACALSATERESHPKYVGHDSPEYVATHRMAKQVAR